MTIPSEPLLSISQAVAATRQNFSISVLLVDDQPIVAEAIRRLLGGEKDIVFHYCSNPVKAIETAIQVKPTVILQDLVLPGFDGLWLVKYFRSHVMTQDIPIIVLSTQENPQVKAESFTYGANDYLVKLPDRLELIARIRYHSRAYIRLLERDEAFRKLEENQKVLNAELGEAAAYVKSLLPKPLHNDITTNWRFIPSAQLGGDSFGYHWLDANHFAIYLLDVCGHGVGAALLSISVATLLRSQNLPKANFKDPSSVLQNLNLAFQMEKHNNMFFTIWYGVYSKESQQLVYATGGHPPAILITGSTQLNAQVFELKTSGVVIGALPEAEFENAYCQIEAYNKLYLFSDGVYEIVKPEKGMLDLQNLIQVLTATKKEETSELDSIVTFAQEFQGKKEFNDDFSLLQVIFSGIKNQ